MPMSGSRSRRASRLAEPGEEVRDRWLVLGSRPSQLRPTQTSAVVSLGARRDEPTRLTPELVAGAPWVGQGARTRHGVRANTGRCGGSLARPGHRLSATNSSELAASLTHRFRE